MIRLLGSSLQIQSTDNNHIQLYSYFFVIIYCYYIFLTTINNYNFIEFVI